VIHPQIVVERDVAGHLREIRGLTGANDEPLRPTQIRESWMHIELAPTGAGIDDEVHARIESELIDRLRGVREVVEDWQKMTERAQTVVEELDAQPPPVPEEDIEEAEALMSWLRQDNFVFLGYREYALRVDEKGEDFLQATPGTGLGLLRSDSDQAAALGRRLPSPGPGEGAREAAADRHQEQRPLDRAPAGPPRLRRHQDVRRRRRGHR
jgi:glutamate dehydrogenase